MSRGLHVEQLPAMAERWQLVCWTAAPMVCITLTRVMADWLL